MPKPQRHCTTPSVEIAEPGGQLNALVDQLSGEETRVIVTKRGAPVAALVSLSDLARFDQYERQRAERFKVIDEARAAFSGVPDEEIQHETDRSLGINQAPPETVKSVCQY